MQWCTQWCVPHPCVVHCHHSTIFGENVSLVVSFVFFFYATVCSRTVVKTGRDYIDVYVHRLQLWLWIHYAHRKTRESQSPALFKATSPSGQSSVSAKIFVSNFFLTFVPMTSSSHSCSNVNCCSWRLGKIEKANDGGN